MPRSRDSRERDRDPESCISLLYGLPVLLFDTEASHLQISLHPKIRITAQILESSHRKPIPTHPRMPVTSQPSTLDSKLCHHEMSPVFLPGIYSNILPPSLPTLPDYPAIHSGNPDFLGTLGTTWQRTILASRCVVHSRGTRLKKKTGEGRAGPCCSDLCGQELKRR